MAWQKMEFLLYHKSSQVKKSLTPLNFSLFSKNTTPLRVGKNTTPLKNLACPRMIAHLWMSNTSTEFLKNHEQGVHTKQICDKNWVEAYFDETHVVSIPTTQVAQNHPRWNRRGSPLPGIDHLILPFKKYGDFSKLDWNMGNFWNPQWKGISDRDRVLLI